MKEILSLWEEDMKVTTQHSIYVVEILLNGQEMSNKVGVKPILKQQLHI